VHALRKAAATLRFHLDMRQYQLRLAFQRVYLRDEVRFTLSALRQVGKCLLIEERYP